MDLEQAEERGMVAVDCVGTINQGFLFSWNGHRLTNAMGTD
jgi:hypothetical protein